MQIIAPRRDADDPRFFEYQGVRYPDYCRRGPASRFVREFALEFCQGRGINIGYGRLDWNFFPANTILLDISTGHDCNRITRIDGIDRESFDFIFSSHTLEHLDDWKASLADWVQCLRPGGSMFLYLPHPSMEYWQPQNNRKHKHVLVPELVCAFLQTLHMGDILCSGVDLYYSFCVTGVRCPVPAERMRPESRENARENSTFDSLHPSRFSADEDHSERNEVGAGAASASSPSVNGSRYEPLPQPTLNAADFPA